MIHTVRPVPRDPPARQKQMRTHNARADITTATFIHQQQQQLPPTSNGTLLQQLHPCRVVHTTVVPRKKSIQTMEQNELNLPAVYRVIH